jgi:AhpD family alkylhydroperoxidase
MSKMRMKNPAAVLPEAWKGIGSVMKAISSADVPVQTLELVGLRVSQINGCSACAVGHFQNLKKAGATDERLASVATWHDTPFYSDAERAALALTEVVTRAADHSGELVSDELWDQVTTHFDERQVSGIILQIALLNMFNRINATVREEADRPSWAA